MLFDNPAQRRIFTHVHEITAACFLSFSSGAEENGAAGSMEQEGRGSTDEAAVPAKVALGGAAAY
ncbi:MAG TPA: hypothetical protein VH682_30420 [Gemmataceae bacterium]